MLWLRFLSTPIPAVTFSRRPQRPTGMSRPMQELLRLCWICGVLMEATIHQPQSSLAQESSAPCVVNKGSFNFLHWTSDWITIHRFVFLHLKPIYNPWVLEKCGKIRIFPCTPLHSISWFCCWLLHMFAMDRVSQQFCPLHEKTSHHFLPVWPCPFCRFNTKQSPYWNAVAPKSCQPQIPQ